MTTLSAEHKTVDDWLAYIEALHPKTIAMGLERVAIVAKRLALQPQFKMITVAGTNGKGSTCAMLLQIYTDAGYQVGCYTSPHLLRYHERVRVNQQEISDTQLCAAFEAVERARADVELTYFEMGTLAAMWHFCQLKLDVVILEVGLGGRLDAVNLWDADCAIVTNVDLDHMEYLGDTREKIGIEKAGVYRKNQISICGEAIPPASLMAYALNIKTQLKVFQRDFNIQMRGEVLHYSDAIGEVVVPRLSLIGSYQMQNAAAVIYAVRSLKPLPVSNAQIAISLPKVQVLGRFQYLSRAPDIIVDVAHNPHAARALSLNLNEITQSKDSGKLLAVFSMLADKDISAVVGLLKHQVDAWYIGEIQHPRAASEHNLKKILMQQSITKPIHFFKNVENALLSACKNASKNDKIIVFGSFFTVAAAIAQWQSNTAIRKT